MVKAWFMDNEDSDQRLEHHLNPPQFLSLEEVKEQTGVLYWKMDAKDYEDELNKIRRERGYSYTDFIEISPHKLKDYESKIRNFFTEHLHTDEEIRFILEGSGYFDVRNHDDNWLRIFVESGDLIVLPAGIYHRFTLDTSNYIRVMRLFVGEPVWTAHNRPSDHLSARQDYLQMLGKLVKG